MEIEEIVVFEFAWIHTYKSCMYNWGKLENSVIEVEFCTSKKLLSVPTYVDVCVLSDFVCVYDGQFNLGL